MEEEQIEQKLESTDNSSSELSDQESNKITYLTSDDEIRNQSFVCLSFITPELIKNCKVRGLKVRGVYSSEADAKRRCEELNKLDPDFNIYIAPVGCWLPWTDDPDKAEDCEYANSELNKLMKAYKENQVKAKMLHENRKQDLIEKNIRESEERKMKSEKVNNADKTDEVDNADKTDEVDNADKTDEVDNADNADKTDEVDNADKTDEVNEIDEVDEINETITQEEIQRIEETIKKDKDSLNEKQDSLNEQTNELNENEKMRQHIKDELEKAKQLYEKMKDT